MVIGVFDLLLILLTSSGFNTNSKIAVSYPVKVNWEVNEMRDGFLYLKIGAFSFC